MHSGILHGCQHLVFLVYDLEECLPLVSVGRIEQLCCCSQPNMIRADVSNHHEHVYESSLDLNNTSNIIP